MKTARTKTWAAGTAMAVRGVLAGAYRGADLSERSTLTHAVLVDDEGFTTENKTVCRRVLTDRLVDTHGGDLRAPTCTECAQRAAR